MHNSAMNHNEGDIIYGINCEVTNCHYNEHKSCVAEEIKVGPQYAASAGDTSCITFKPR